MYRVSSQMQRNLTWLELVSLGLLLKKLVKELSMENFSRGWVAGYFCCVSSLFVVTVPWLKLWSHRVISSWTWRKYPSHTEPTKQRHTGNSCLQLYLHASATEQLNFTKMQYKKKKLYWWNLNFTLNLLFKNLFWTSFMTLKAKVGEGNNRFCEKIDSAAKANASQFTYDLMPWLQQCCSWDFE